MYRLMWAGETIIDKGSLILSIIKDCFIMPLILPASGDLCFWRAS